MDQRRGRCTGDEPPRSTRTSQERETLGKGRCRDRRSQGIGRAIALALAGEGASAVAGDLKSNGLQETEHVADGILVPHVCDVRSAESVRHIVRLAEERFGALHVMVNNAGVAQPP